MAVIKVETYIQDPDEKLDYGFDWSKPLAVDTPADTITASVWVLPTGITQSSSPAPSFDNSTTTIWLEGGTDNQNYTIINQITTAATRKMEASFVVSVRKTG